MGELGLLEWYELTRSTMKIKDAKSGLRLQIISEIIIPLVEQPEERNRPYWAPAWNLHYHLKKMLEMRGKLNPALQTDSRVLILLLVTFLAAVLNFQIKAHSGRKSVFRLTLEDTVHRGRGGMIAGVWAAGHTALTARDEHWCSPCFLTLSSPSLQPMGWCYPQLGWVLPLELTESRNSLTDMPKGLSLYDSIFCHLDSSYEPSQFCP